MNKLTPEEVSKLTDDECDVLVAECQGWLLHGSINPAWLGNIDFNYIIDTKDYHPTQASAQGKAQAFRLLDKYDLQITIEDRTDSAVWYGSLFSGKYVIYENLQRAIVEAVINLEMGK